MTEYKLSRLLHFLSEFQHRTEAHMREDRDAWFYWFKDEDCHAYHANGRQPKEKWPKRTWRVDEKI